MVALFDTRVTADDLENTVIRKSNDVMRLLGVFQATAEDGAGQEYLTSVQAAGQRFLARYDLPQQQRLKF